MKKIIFYISFALCCVETAAQKNEIPNGSFEVWPDDFNPAQYGSFQADKKELQSLRTVFKSTDARSGKYSVRLKNASVTDMMTSMGVKLPPGISIPETVIPAGIWHCTGNCKTPPKGKAGMDRARFTVTKKFTTICGYYKGTLAGGDKLFVSIVMYKGNNIMGGSDAGAIQHAFVTGSSASWTKFEIPIAYLPGNENTVPDAASIEISIVGKNFPQSASAGASGQSVHTGTEVLVDDVEFCVGKADVLVFLPKVMNEKNTSPVSEEEPAPSPTNASNGTNQQIPQNANFDPGVQTFVNLDNDDNDEFFDFNPDDNEKTDKEVAGGDDELVKIILRIPAKTLLGALESKKEMTAKLDFISGEGHIRAWETDTKSKNSKSSRIPIPYTFDVEKDFTTKEGDYFIKEIWIEGILPHTKQRGTKLKFTHSEDPDFEDKFSITIIGIEKIEWIGKGNSRNDDDVLDEDMNHRQEKDTRGVQPKECGGLVAKSTLKPEGVRVFPGRRVVGNVIEKNKRSIVDVKVTLSVKPVIPVKIYFDSYDVDDPTASGTNIPPKGDPTYQYWIDNENEKNDNQGTVGDIPGSSTGFFPKGKNGILEFEFTEDTAKFEFEVTMQPGDNFRIVGNADQDFLRSLRNDDNKLNVGNTKEIKNENKQRITNYRILEANSNDPKLAEIRSPEKYASKTLSVWRFLYAEVDYMDVLGEDKLTGTVFEVETNTPAQGQTKITLSTNITSAMLYQWKTNIPASGTNGVKNSFKGGRIELATGAGSSISFPVTGNSAETAGVDYVIINGIVPETVKGKSFFLQDDDERKGFKKGDNLKTIIPGRKAVDAGGKNYCTIADRFEYAYIIPDFTKLNTAQLNPNPVVPFFRNLKNYDTNDDYLLETYAFDNEATDADSDFWTAYILFAYKGALHEDGDPDPNDELVLSGITDKKKKGIHIFLEGVLERNNGTYYMTNNLWIGENDCITHELGHLFGGEHTDIGLMGEPPGKGWFSPLTISKIRKSKHP